MRTPNFFIIGAPKCGTTSLARWLSGHPQVFMSVPKEPHFFNTDMANRNVRQWDEYLELFQRVGEGHEAVGEASTWYLFSENAVSEIEAAFPGARYIVMTREPVDMALSLYQHNVRHLHEDASSFQEAWRLQEARYWGERIPSTCTEPSFLQYRRACSLGSMLERLFDRVPEERVLHMPLDQVKQDPRNAYLRVLSFLDIADDGRTDFKPENEARIYRSRFIQKAFLAGGRLRARLGIRQGLGLTRINESKRKLAEDLPNELKAEIEEAFSVEKEKLCQFKIKKKQRVPCLL